MSDQFTMRDPRNQYPKPKFEDQPQDAPGLAKNMVPQPDHGEKTYIGSGRLHGRKALITGGDSGIGRAVAIAYAREGADVAINYLESESEDAREVVELLRSEGSKIIEIPGDIRDESFCTELVEKAASELGGLDILVNNAGKQVAVKDFTNITTEQFDATFKTNVYAMFWITKATMKYLKPGAAVINTTSIQAYQPSETLVDYASTKAAIKAFTQALGGQLAEKGIRVNAVAPGPIWTPLQPSGGQPQEKIPEFGMEVPLKRPGQPAEVAPVYVFLASQESSYVIGETYGVTGGNPTT
jgi:NAD(P)-dependent dehydrogenase (short-subunit alcohol dehydrogenase family)